MGLVKDLLLKLRYPVILLIAGVLMILLAQKALSGPLNKLEIRERPSTSVVYLMTGLGLLVASALLYVFEFEDVVPWTRCKLVKTKTGFKTTYKDTELCVEFGVLQELYSSGDGCAVVLPANEFFDDRCFNDVHTAAGGFIRSFFDASQAMSLKSLVDQKLVSHPFERVTRENKQEATSYGTGVCIYLEHPFGTPHLIILSAVATDRENAGIRAEVASIFQVMKGVHQIIARERTISTIYIPLLGAGKGGVPAQLAFRALLIAALEARCAQGGHAMKEVHFVVFQGAGKDPQVSEKLAKRAVRELVCLYQAVAR